MDVAEIELRMLTIITETIGHVSERVLKYTEALVEIAAQTRLSGGIPGVDGPNPAELRCAMLEQCAKSIDSDRDIMKRYARAARAMAMYERIVGGTQFEVKPDGSISVIVRSKPLECQPN